MRSLKNQSLCSSTTLLISTSFLRQLLATHERVPGESRQNRNVQSNWDFSCSSSSLKIIYGTMISLESISFAWIISLMVVLIFFLEVYSVTLSGLGGLQARNSGPQRKIMEWGRGREWWLFRAGLLFVLPLSPPLFSVVCRASSVLQGSPSK